MELLASLIRILDSEALERIQRLIAEELYLRVGTDCN